MTNLEFQSKIWAVNEHSSIQSTLIQTVISATMSTVPAVLPAADPTNLGQRMQNDPVKVW